MKVKVKVSFKNPATGTVEKVDSVIEMSPHEASKFMRLGLVVEPDYQRKIADPVTVKKSSSAAPQAPASKKKTSKKRAKKPTA